MKLGNDGSTIKKTATEKEDGEILSVEQKQVLKCMGLLHKSGILEPFDSVTLTNVFLNLAIDACLKCDFTPHTFEGLMKMQIEEYKGYWENERCTE